MGWRNTNIFAWSPQDVATFLDEIGLSGLKSAVLVKSITGPQLISMSPEELSEQLGATSLQARKIHSELNGLGSSSDLGSVAIASATAASAAPAPVAAPINTVLPLTPAEEAAAYNTAGTTGAFIDPRNPNQSLQDYYNSNQSLSGFQIGGAAAVGAVAGAGAAALYSPMGTTAAFNAYPLPASPTGALAGQPGSGMYHSPAQSAGGVGGGGVTATPYNNNINQVEQQSSKDTYLNVSRSFFPWWIVLLLPLLLVAIGDLGITIYMNGEFSDNKTSIFSEWGYVKSEGVYSPHNIDVDIFWCVLFYVAQGYTILITILLMAFISTVGRSGSLSGTRNVAFATLLLSFLGLVLYTVPIVKWTYVIVTDYSASDAFSGAIIPAVAFGLEWLAVLLWLVCLIVASVELGLLCRKRYKV